MRWLDGSGFDNGADPIHDLLEPDAYDMDPGRHYDDTPPVPVVEHTVSAVGRFGGLWHASCSCSWSFASWNREKATGARNLHAWAVAR